MGMFVAEVGQSRWETFMDLKAWPKNRARDLFLRTAQEQEECKHDEH